MKNILIGMGTGRCGSKSLARLMGKQNGWHSTHESKPVLPWLVNKELFKQKIEDLSARKSDNIFDIGMYYIQYVEEFINTGLNIRFICKYITCL